MASLNGEPVGQVQWDGIAPQILEAAFDSTLLSSDPNTVTLQALKPDGTTLSVFWVDRFETIYQRSMSALDDALVLRGDDNPTVTVHGFSTRRITVLDIADPLQPKIVKRARVRTEAGGYAVSFRPEHADTPYFATARLLEPESLNPASADLFDGPAADYLIIAPESLRSGAEALAEYRSARFSTRVVSLQEIYDAYSDGIVDPTAIHAFLADAYETWPLPLLHVQLIGRGTYDYKDIFKAGDNLLPVIMAPTYHGLFAADNRFADVVGQDGVPEFALSRLPVISVAEVMTYLNKLRAYEQAPADGPHGVLMVADNPEPGAFFDADSDAVAANLPRNSMYLGFTMIQPPVRRSRVQVSLQHSTTVRRL